VSISRFCRYALIAVPLAAALAGCGGGTFAPGPHAPGPTNRSWADRQAKGETLLYVSDLGANAVDIYTYPDGKLVGNLHDFGSVAGLCADKTGDVFVVDEAGPVQVFAHGGSTPMRKLATKGAPYGCAIDPTTGDLALTNLSSYLYGTVSIYPKAQGRPKSYYNKTVSTTDFCSYDDKGNLFIDGGSTSAEFIVAELPKGKQSIGIFHPVKNVTRAGGVQWDGTDIAFADDGGGVIYRISESGAIKQTITLHDGTDVQGFWLDGSTLIGPNAQSDGTVNFWHYPAGGSPAKTISGFSYPIAATISAAP
jgi:hypothetical protein